MGNAVDHVRFGGTPTTRLIEAIFQKEISMRKLFALVAIVGVGVSIIGCSEAKKDAKKPAEPPAGAATEAPK
jgi:hypothetical protein